VEWVESPVGVQVGSAAQGVQLLLLLHHLLLLADLGVVRMIPMNLLASPLGYAWRNFLRCLAAQVEVLADAGCCEGLVLVVNSTLVWAAYVSQGFRAEVSEALPVPPLLPCTVGRFRRKGVVVVEAGREFQNQIMEYRFPEAGE
jgi:hypothetical protein